jgi:hypothetical protein
MEGSMKTLPQHPMLHGAADVGLTQIHTVQPWHAESVLALSQQRAESAWRRHRPTSSESESLSAQRKIAEAAVSAVVSSPADRVPPLREGLVQVGFVVAEMVAVSLPAT